MTAASACTLLASVTHHITGPLLSVLSRVPVAYLPYLFTALCQDALTVYVRLRLSPSDINILAVPYLYLYNLEWPKAICSAFQLL